nr:MAG: VP2 [Shelly headland virus]
MPGRERQRGSRKKDEEESDNLKDKQEIEDEQNKDRYPQSDNALANSKRGQSAREDRNTREDTIANTDSSVSTENAADKSKRPDNDSGEQSSGSKEDGMIRVSDLRNILNRLQLDDTVGTLGGGEAKLRTPLTDAVFRAIEQEATIDKISRGTLSRVSEPSVIDVNALSERYPTNLAPHTVNTPKVVPHFYQLRVIRAGVYGMYGGQLEGGHGYDIFPFFTGMKEAFGSGFDYSYVRIHTNQEGFQLTVDPLNLDETVCRIGKQDARRLGLTTLVGDITEKKMEDIESPTEFMNFVVGLVGIAGQIGRFLLIGRKSRLDKHLLTFRETGTKSFPFENMNGWLADDDYHNYPHVPEMIMRCAEYEWFAAEVREHWAGQSLGTIGELDHGARGVVTYFNRKLMEPCVMNLDFFTANAYANVLEEYNQERMNVDSYVGFLQICQPARMDVIGDHNLLRFKTYYRKTVDLEVELSRILLFPSAPIYPQCLRLGSLLSPNVRNYILNKLLHLGLSKLDFIQMVPSAEAFAGLDSRMNVGITSNIAMGLCIREWETMIRKTSPHDICQKIACDLMAPFSNCTWYDVDLCSQTSRKFLFAIIGAKVAMMMQPNLYQYNPHVKVQMILSIMNVFFKHELGVRIQQNGYGVDATGRRLTNWHDLKRTRFDSPFFRFTLFDPVPEPNRDMNQERWRLFSHVLQWLVGNDISVIRRVEAADYGFGVRRVRLPGECHVPMKQEPIGQLPAHVVLYRALDFAKTYNDAFFKPVDRVQQAGEKAAFMQLLGYCERYISSFSQWFHWVYCPLYLEVALHPLIWWDLQVGDNVWKRFYAVREQLDVIRDHGVVGAPYAHPVPALFDTDPAFQPFGMFEGNDLFLRVHAPGSMMRGGLLDTAAVIQYQDYDELYQSNDSETMVQDYVDGVYGARQLLEALRLVADVSLGTLFRDSPIGVYIRDAFMRGKFPVRVFGDILTVYGVRIDSMTLAGVGGTRINNQVSADYRVYFPAWGRVDAQMNFIEEPIQIIDPVRASIRRNAAMLLKAVFDPQIGMIRFRTGVTFSMIPLTDMTFRSSHGLFPYKVYVTNEVSSHFDELRQQMHSRHLIYALWRTPTGRRVQHQLRVRDGVDMLTQISDLVGEEVSVVEFVITNLTRYSSAAHAFIKENILERRAIVSIPTVRLILQHHPISISDVEHRFKMYDLRAFDRLPSMRENGLMRVHIVDTTYVRGGDHPGHIVKPMLPSHGSDDSFVFATDVNYAPSRPKGHVIRLSEFFPPVILDGNPVPRVVNPRTNNAEPGLDVYPYGLRSLCHVYHYDPLYKPDIVSQLT